MADNNPCRYCVKPKRQPGCQDHCPEGVAWKKQHEEQKAAADKIREVNGGIYQQKVSKVTKAVKRRRRPLK